MGAVTDHVKEYAKSYTGAAASLAIQPIADHIANILMWALSLARLVMPEGIQASVRYILVAAVIGLVVKYVPNTPRE